MLLQIQRARHTQKVMVDSVRQLQTDINHSTVMPPCELPPNVVVLSSPPRTQCQEGRTPQHSGTSPSEVERWAP